MYDLLIYLLDNTLNLIASTQTQLDFFNAMTTFKIMISNLKTDIADQSEEQKKENFCKTRKCFE